MTGQHIGFTNIVVNIATAGIVFYAS